MDFPAWVIEPTNAPLEVKRTKRLQYMIRRAGLQLVDGSGSIAPIANACGFAVNTICKYMTRGSFPQSCALTFEHVFGRELCPHELLMDPMGKTNKAPKSLAG